MRKPTTYYNLSSVVLAQVVVVIKNNWTPTKNFSENYAPFWLYFDQIL